MLEFRSCSDVIVTGVTLQNAPYWAVHPYNCSRFSMQQARMTAPKDVILMTAPAGRWGAHMLRSCAPLPLSTPLEQFLSTLRVAEAI